MTDRGNFYALETALSANGEHTEFGVVPMRDWLAEIRGLGLRRAVPQLIVKLDRMSSVAMSTAARLNVLRELKRPLLKAAAGLPKPIGSSHQKDSGDSGGVLLEQRLYCLMVKNLKQVLLDLDYSMDAFSAEMDKRRSWALRNLFRFLGRLIEFSLFWGRPLPARTWQESHDLHAYVLARGIAPTGGRGRRARRGDDFDPQEEYKRLLLLGLAGSVLKDWSRGSLVHDRIQSWALNSSLQNPEPYVGEFDLFVVESSKDAPPRQLRGILTESFCGWVLMPASGFLDYAAAVKKEAPIFSPTADLQSVSAMN